MYSAHSPIFFDETELVFWEKTRPTGCINPDKIDVWRLQVSGNKPHLTSFYELLGPEEKHKAGSFLHEADSLRYVSGKAMLRILLAEYLNIDPESLTFGLGMNNKPFLNTQTYSSIEFNISHSGEYVLIAIADKPVGIDIEHYKDHGIQEIMQVIFSQNEISFINEQDQPEKTFYQLWTRKEALLKATAKGLNNDITAIPCLTGKHFISHMNLNSHENWKVNSFDVDEEHTASVAFTGINKKIFFKEYNCLE